MSEWFSIRSCHGVVHLWDHSSGAPHRSTWNTSQRRLSSTCTNSASQDTEAGEEEEDDDDERGPAAIPGSSLVQPDQEEFEEDAHVTRKRTKLANQELWEQQFILKTTEDKRQTVKGSDVVSGVLCTRVQGRVCTGVLWNPFGFCKEIICCVLCSVKPDPVPALQSIIYFILSDVHGIQSVLLFTPLCHCCQCMSQCIYIIFISLYKLVWSVFTSCKSTPWVFLAFKNGFTLQVFKKCMYTSVSVCIKSTML